VKVATGGSLIGLLSGLLDSESSTELAAAVREALAFARADHRWDIVLRVWHNGEEEEDE
jgi:hypothetical protein